MKNNNSKMIGTIMSSTGEQPISITKLSIDELEEKLKRHEFFVRLVKDEISKRKGLKAEKKKEDKKDDKKKEDKGEKKPGIDATKDDMKAILKKNGIEFKVSSKKEDLEELVRKNNLVRMAESAKKERLKVSDSK